MSLILVNRVFNNKYKDSFIVLLGVNLLFLKFKISGPLKQLLDPILRGIIGLLIEEGTFQIDLTLDSIREGRKIPEFEKAAMEAYRKASAKVYTEIEKEKIRREYFKILENIVIVGNRRN